MNAQNVARTIAFTALAALAAAIQPAAADNADAAAPITVDRCTMSERARIEDPEHAGPHESEADQLTIAYDNVRDVAATEVRFRVRYSGQRLNLVDRGPVPPHGKLTHTFNRFTLTFAGSPASCSVTSATFADGSHWDAPDELASPAPVKP